MKVLMVNGSSKTKGCTFTALEEIGKELRKNQVEYEIIQLGGKPVMDCIACNQCKGRGCIFQENGVPEFLEKAKEADGFVFGSPVYFAHPSGRLLSFLDRVFYSCEKNHIYVPFAGKPGVAVVSARRGGTTASLDAINKYFSIASMPIVSSTYWNMVHGSCPEDVLKDEEGLQTMRNIAKNMIWMMKKLKEGKPELESEYQTNFIH